MSKKVLVIESDVPFARDVTKALEARGFQVRITGDGKDGIDFARGDRPDAIALCVELPKMSGYSVVQKLKKDEDLRTIPVVLVSAEATPETFEAHKKLKARAEEYLLKPFEPSVLVDKICALTGVDAPRAVDEEVVTLEEELAINSLEGVQDEVSSVEPVEVVSSGDVDEDDDLRLLDDAFQNLSAGVAPASVTEPEDVQSRRSETPVSEEELSAAAESLPANDESSARGEIDEVAGSADAFLETLSPVEVAPPPPSPPPSATPRSRTEESRRSPSALRGASPSTLRSAGIPLLDTEPSPPASKTPRESPREESQREDRADQGKARIAELTAKIAELTSRIPELTVRITELTGRADKAEAELRGSRDEARKANERANGAQEEIATLRKRAEAAERTSKTQAAEGAASASKIAELQREIEKARTELVVARGEADGARNEVDKRATDLEKRLADFETQRAKSEERTIKAYQKIKDDERIREKIRKALSVVLQLLDEAAPKEVVESARRAGTRE